MIRGLFPRVFSNFREAGIVHAKFVVGGNGGTTATFTLKSAVGKANYQGITLVRSGVGLLTLTFTGGARNLVLLDLQQVVVAGADVSASYQGFGLRPAFVEGTGVIGVRVLTNAGVAGGEMAFTAGDEVHVTLIADK